MMVQKTIEKNLRQVYPYIKIVGEEDKTHEMYKLVKSTVDPSTLQCDIVKHQDLRHLFNLRKEKLKAFINESPCGYGILDEEEALYFDQEDAVVWLDPLDGTRGFSRGQVEGVTSILGKIIFDNVIIISLFY